ncbi:MAG: hypothetical protein ABIQ35_06390 [Verrucomicrobiota bacterium]
MRALSIISFSLLLCFGCKRYEAEQAALDVLVSSGNIRRIEVVNDEIPKTNVFTGSEAERILNFLNASNRVAKSSRGKSYGLGEIYLIGDKKREWIFFYPGEQVLSFRKYEFTVKNTNEISELFK